MCSPVTSCGVWSWKVLWFLKSSRVRSVVITSEKAVEADGNLKIRWQFENQLKASDCPTCSLKPPGFPSGTLRSHLQTPAYAYDLNVQLCSWTGRGS